jgi:Fur family ferric uptake transcriptional regulator
MTADTPAPGSLAALSGDLVLAARLRKAGLRATRPRLLTYRALADLGGHRSVDEVVVELRRRAQPLPRTSVYNVVEALRLAGVVMGADAGPGRALYEVATTKHHHFVCRACAEVIDVPCVTGETPCLEAGGDAGVPDEAQVIFRGLCKACAGIG